MERSIPGHVLPLCVSCIHRGDPFHPMPCGRCRWEGPYHRQPALERDADGAVCGDYEQAEPTTPGGVESLEP
jgi:hypothetical protein